MTKENIPREGLDEPVTQNEPAKRAPAAHYLPANLDLLLGEQVLRITWNDGITSTFPAAFLRSCCPCAFCRTEREKQKRTLLPILPKTQSREAHITGGQLVGHYALELEWSDGHNAGIYDFRLLRDLHDRRP